jgi:hypothetical protein
MARPPTLNRVIRVRQDGTQVTAAEEVIERIQLGMPIEDAADSAGIPRSTLHNWRKAGGIHRAAQAGGATLRKAEREYVEFLDAYERATAEAELNRLTVVHRAAVGGMTLTKQVSKWKVERARDGTEVLTEIERTVTTEQLAPQWTAAAWWLERRIPQRYARRVEVSGPDGGPIAVASAEDLLLELEAFKAGAATAAAVASDS